MLCPTKYVDAAHIQKGEEVAIPHVSLCIYGFSTLGSCH